MDERDGSGTRQKVREVKVKEPQSGKEGCWPGRGEHTQVEQERPEEWRSVYLCQERG